MEDPPPQSHLQVVNLSHSQRTLSLKVKGWSVQDAIRHAAEKLGIIITIERGQIIFTDPTEDTEGGL